MDDLQTPNDGGYVCPHCRNGTLRLRQVTFAHWYAGHFITIPNFPGWVCDVCGEREYDAVALEHMQLLLGADAELRPHGGRRAWRAMPNFNRAARPSGRRPV